MKAYEEIKAVIEGMKEDVEKHDKGIKAAWPRVRASLMKIKNLAHEGRKKVEEIPY